MEEESKIDRMARLIDVMAVQVGENSHILALVAGDVSVLKDDVSVLKDDVAVLKDDVRDLKVGFVRMEGRLGRIETLESQKT